jgi:hypothetical protein
MRRFSALVLLAALSIGGSAHAQVYSTPQAQSRAARKADKNQRKAMKKYAKAQRKAQRKMLKKDRKNTHYPKHSY